MAGSILGHDQVRRINAAYPALVAHIRSLLSADRSAAGLMRAHHLAEHLDTTELAFIFSGLTFISPAEKRALVRAAIFDVMLTSATDVSAALAETEVSRPSIGGTQPAGAVPLKTFNPPAFNLNVQRAEDFHGQRPADTPPPAPVVTSTHRPIVQQANSAPAEEGK